MAEDKIIKISQGIYDHIGGPENVEKLIHCMTRVRITVRDMSKVDMTGLKAVNGVLGVVDDDTLQVVVGPGTVNKVAQNMVAKVGVELGEKFPVAAGGSSNLDAKAAEMKQQQKANVKQTKFKKVLKSISNIFIPLIPALVGAGMIGGIAAILTNLQTAGDLGKNWAGTISVLNLLKDGLFSYLAVYVGVNAANEFGATPGLGGIIGAITLLDNILPKPPVIDNIFNGKPLESGQGGIIGVIFAVWVLSIVEKKLHKWMPEAIDIIVTPTISLLLIGLMTVFLIMPGAGVISDSLVGSILWLLKYGGVFSGFVLGSLFLPMVMVGLHQILIPIHVELIAKTGSTTLYPILAMAGAGQVGAAIALWVRCRQNKELVQLIKGALPVGILGIGEPLIYGVILPLGRPFVTACIGGGIGGAAIGAFGKVGAIALGPSGLALIPLIVKNKILDYILGLLIAYAAGFVLTLLFGIPQEAMVSTEAEGVLPDNSSAGSYNVTADINATASILSPVDGDYVNVSDIKDPMMAQESMGKSSAVKPDTDSILRSPVNGEVTMVAETKHAIGFKDEIGEEVLVHIGIDTVKLEGKAFHIDVKPGDKVIQGQKIGSVEWEEIISKEIDPVTVTIVTNSNEFNIIKTEQDGRIDENSVLMNSESAK